MNCPICNSDQTTFYKVKFNCAYLECANCDFEGTTDIIAPDEYEAVAGAWQRDQQRRR